MKVNHALGFLPAARTSVFRPPGRTHVWVQLTKRSASQCLLRNSETTIDVKLVTDCGLIANLRILFFRETGLAILFCPELTLNSVMCAYHIEISSRESQVHVRHVRVGSISQSPPAARLFPSGTPSSGLEQSTMGGCAAELIISGAFTLTENFLSVPQFH